MVQIPEYTRRENAAPVSRGGMSLSLPNALTQPVGGEAVKKGLELSKDLADVYVKMKERRDDGIVSAFLNQYSKDSTQKLLELRDRYRGQDSKRVMPEFQKWRDQYITEHSSYDEDTAKEGVIYLEDEAQNRLAKERLDAYNVRDINSISSYIAQEEEKFRVNNINATVADNVERIVGENILPNTEISKAIIKSYVADLHRGQPKSFIDRATNDILDSAIAGNIMRDSNVNPLASIARYNDKNFTKEMRPETKKKVQQDVLKSFENYASQTIAEDTAYMRPTTLPLPAILGNEFFSDLDVARIEQRIMDDAGKKEKDILQTKHENSVRLQNDMILKAMNPDGSINTYAFTEEDMMNIGATEGGAKTINTINHIKVNTQNDAYNIENGLPTREFKSDDIERYENALYKARNGYYSTIGDMYDDIAFLPSDAQNDILRTFLGNLKFDRDAEKLKSNGIDIEKDIEASYKLLLGLNPDNSDNTYRNFRNDVVENVMKLQLLGQPIDSKKIKEISIGVVKNMYDAQTDDSVVKNIIADLDKWKKENYKNTSIIDYTKLQEQATDIVNDSNISDVIPDEVISKFNDLIINGDVDGALFMLNFYRKNNIAYNNMLNKQKEEKRKERLKTLYRFMPQPPLQINREEFEF